MEMDDLKLYQDDAIMLDRLTLADQAFIDTRIYDCLNIEMKKVTDLLIKNLTTYIS